MTYSDRERELIFCMKEVGASWKDIAKAVGKNITAVKMYWKRTHEREFLPPKEIIKKTLTSGRTGYVIKSITKESPLLPVRDLQVELQRRLGPDTPCPKKSTINNFLLKNNLKMIKLRKKAVRNSLKV